MALAVSFRYKDREYYKELVEGEKISFGTHKKDIIQIPDSTEHLLRLKAMGDEVQAAAETPLSLPNFILSCNEIIVLNRSLEATIYISRVIGRGRRYVNLPYQGRITVGRSKDNDIVVFYPIVSGHHFQLIMEAGKVHVEDLRSTNGLYLNGKKISKAIMKSGDVLSVYSFRFVMEKGVLYFENIGNSMYISEKINDRICLLSHGL